MLNNELSCLCSPMTYAWQGGRLLALSGQDFKKMMVTKEMYDEQGVNVCLDAFNL